MMTDIPQVDIIIDSQEISFDLDHAELPKEIEDAAFGSGDYPYKKKMKRRVYEETLSTLQFELGKLQKWLQASGERVVIVFEGRDAAGKGGTINAFRQYLNPRHAKTIALSKPTDRERGEWYYQRYIQHLPTEGEMTLFDRSWYNRAGVEPVMGFCSDEQHQKFLEETPKFEEMLINDGIHLFKFWLNVGQEMQIKRFHDRRQNPLKAWKLSPIDIKALHKWVDYTEARNTMLNATHNDTTPWTIVRSNDKRRARINAITHFLQNMDYKDKDENNVSKIDPLILGQGPGFFNSFGA